MKHFSFLLLVVLLASTFAQDQSSCPNDCNSKGKCVSQTCICNNGWFGTGCTIKGVQLKTGLITKEEVVSQEWQFFNLLLDNFNQGLSIEFEADFQDFVIKSLFEEKDAFETPNNIYDKYYSFLESSNSGIVSFTQKEIQSHSGEKLVIGLKNINTTFSKKVEILVFVSHPDNKDMFEGAIGTIAAIVISNFGAIALLLFCLWRRKVRGERYHTVDFHLGIVAMHSQNAQNLAYIADLIQKKQTLNMADIENYFPTKRFSDFKSLYVQSNCDICLEDFEDESKCRQLYCEHIFHGHCIEEWLLKHNSCPDCRKSMTKEAIEQFFRAQKQSEEEKAPNFQADQEGLHDIEHFHLNIKNEEVEIEEDHREDAQTADRTPVQEISGSFQLHL